MAKYKVCIKCKEEKSIDEFYKHGKRGTVNTCKVCYKEYYNKESNSKNIKRRYQERRLKLIQLKGNKCEICGLIDNPAVYDFHHKDTYQKEFEIAKFLMYKWERILQELDKCILICSNCHRKLHSGGSGHRKIKEA